ncbi:MAG: SRPBCC family protein [Verrucomicrobiales bacterium]|nr:SRPBCC family protein [Verrucomicrobiales bacterium]
MQPAAFRVSRSSTIAASPATLFEQINDLHKFQTWNPWAKIDPASRITYTGPVSGVDAAYHWVGNAELGEGSMTIIESKPGELMRARMDFMKPFAASYTAEFTLKPEADKTTVTWSLFGENDFMSKAVKLIMNVDKMCGDQFEKGLAALGEIVALPAKP